jgi:GR25 family glycosyltransferase involved in LPS biosynthesis
MHSTAYGPKHSRPPCAVRAGPIADARFSSSAAALACRLRRLAAMMHEFPHAVTYASNHDVEPVRRNMRRRGPRPQCSRQQKGSISMDCYYINLDNATERRLSLEASFEKHFRPGWTLHRFSALDQAYIEAHGIEGSRTAREKACFLSHKAVIERCADDSKPVLIVEDDTMFGLATFEIIDGFLQQNAGSDWDIIFTDLAVLDLGTMVTMAANRKKLMQDKTVIPLDLARIPFAGASSYLINGGSRRKVLACLDSCYPIDAEYDLFLARAIRDGKLKAAVLFPFVTTLSTLAASSQIQPAFMKTANLAWNTFRNMMWLESAPGSCGDNLRQLENALNKPELCDLATLFAALCLYTASEIPTL